MGEVRVFIGVGQEVPAAVAQGGTLLAAGGRAHMLTPTLSAVFPEHDEEDLEYEALWEAAADCPGRIAVAAADVPAAWVSEQPEEDALGHVVVSAEIPLSAVVSWHIELAEDGPDDELSWYDVTETHEVARLMA
ncbi:Uncharacterised protein [Dermatophilus congolensis]|uniref:Uncharacterized protein n=1 Tax=Dermatophilus congolensis TaxID=1863 RepID=A0AA46BME1_9MICO|nr:hypothetical protein [Dermatophilus congolensis]STD06837.1 Uncharacterised protein [Dermatophilus congolensis]